MYKNNYVYKNNNQRESYGKGNMVLLKESTDEVGASNWLEWKVLLEHELLKDFGSHVSSFITQGLYPYENDRCQRPGGCEYNVENITRNLNATNNMGRNTYSYEPNLYQTTSSESNQYQKQYDCIPFNSSQFKTIQHQSTQKPYSNSYDNEYQHFNQPVYKSNQYQKQ